MDYPIYLRPKFRLLSKVLKKKIPLPKRYRFCMSDIFWYEYRHPHSIDTSISMCKCSSSISDLVQICDTPDGRGKGAYAKKNIPVGTYIGCYIGKVVEHIEEHDICYFKDIEYRFELPFQQWAVCARDFGNETRFFNHSDNDNVFVKGVCHSDGGEYHLGFFTCDDILKGEELTISYGEGYWNTASKFGIIRSDDSKMREIIAHIEDQNDYYRKNFYQSVDN